MKKILSVLIAALIILIPSLALAHERHIFEIGGESYQFVVGSLNEPISVDDKTGVDLRVSLVGHETMPATDHHAAGGALPGLEEALQVELSAGGMKKVLALSPVFNTPGSYKAAFYPTVATTYSYRFFGTIEGTPVDLTFTCNPAGHATAAEDRNRIEMGPGVVRTLKTGSFGCPVEKGALGFPEPAASTLELKDEAGSAGTWGMVGSLLGLGGLVLAGFALRRRQG